MPKEKDYSTAYNKETGYFKNDRVKEVLALLNKSKQGTILEIDYAYSYPKDTRLPQRGQVSYVSQGGRICKDIFSISIQRGYSALRFCGTYIKFKWLENFSE